MNTMTNGIILLAELAMMPKSELNLGIRLGLCIYPQLQNVCSHGDVLELLSTETSECTDCISRHFVVSLINIYGHY